MKLVKEIIKSYGQIMKYSNQLIFLIALINTLTLTIILDDLGETITGVALVISRLANLFILMVIFYQANGYLATQPIALSIAMRNAMQRLPQVIMVFFGFFILEYGVLFIAHFSQGLAGEGISRNLLFIVISMLLIGISIFITIWTLLTFTIIATTRQTNAIAALKEAQRLIKGHYLWLAAVLLLMMGGFFLVIYGLSSLMLLAKNIYVAGIGQFFLGVISIPFIVALNITLLHTLEQSKKGAKNSY